ncbi:MAG TPA: hypothetical protein VEJ41_05515 [Candidatus Acidoferrales bacterium]|nr:hypothetical protein [Candidatus Acidoferrales bacterium]
MKPIVIGYDTQGREARRWFSGQVRPRAIFFDKEPLPSRHDFELLLSQACSTVSDLGARTYQVDGQVTSHVLPDPV